MKIGIFTDSHYSPALKSHADRCNSLSLGKIREALDAFRTEEIEACFCLGDLTDPCESEEIGKRCLDEIVALFSEARRFFPIYVVPGNHDFDSWQREVFFEKLSVPCPPYKIETDGKTFLFLDANYNEAYQSFAEVKTPWYNAWLPPYEMEYLQKELNAAQGECVVVVHELLDPLGDKNHTVRNADRVRDILERSGKVHLVLEGHYHYGAENTVNGILYKTYPAMCVGTENRYFILDV